MNLSNIRLASDLRAKSLDTGIPRSMKIVGHEAKHVHVSLHGLGVETTKVPIVGSKSHAYAIMASEGCFHFLDERDKVGSIRSPAASLRGTWVFPIDVNALKAVLRHEFL